MKSKFSIILFCCFLIVNINLPRVTAEEIPKLKLEESFEIPIPANTNNTIVLSDYIDTTLFNLTDHSLRYEFFSITRDNFSLNNINLTLIHFYNEIQFVTNTTISSYIRATYPSGSTITGTSVFDYDEFSYLTTKKIFNINNFSIVLQFNVEIIEEMLTITSQIDAISLIPTILILVTSLLFKKKKL